ncbi:MAG: hypothetical protein M1824_002725 [Vezdaea acicularis]|nr:MAG: hypothetical protein M1824_002725 [Vezdaea acicularis]
MSILSSPLLPLLPPPILLFISSLASPPPSYFSSKNNVFNLFFVKILWAWTTVAFFLLRPTRNALARYLAFTAYWIVWTQWFFGPPIIDRGFTVTGGKCEGEVSGDHFTSLACRASGGKWVGGHDISGHVFLLSITSVFLWMEVQAIQLQTPATQSYATKPGPIELEIRNSLQNASRGAGSPAKGTATPSTTMASKAPKPGQWTLEMKFAMGVALMSLYMLMMTAAYFHTAFEKISGVIVAYAAILAVYVLPMVVPALQSYIGMVNR